MLMIKSIISTVALLSCGIIAVAQQQNNHWICGWNNRFDFNTSAPAASYNLRRTLSTCAVSHPVTGDLLFYTNGFQVYDRDDSLMTNGDSLLGPGVYTSAGIFTLQGIQTVAVPFVGDTNKYYIFYTQGSLLAGGVQPGDLYYSVVDLSLSGGMGDVVAGKKNIKIADSVGWG